MPSSKYGNQRVEALSSFYVVVLKALEHVLADVEGGKGEGRFGLRRGMGGKGKWGGGGGGKVRFDLEGGRGGGRIRFGPPLPSAAKETSDK